MRSGPSLGFTIPKPKLTMMTSLPVKIERLKAQLDNCCKVWCYEKEGSHSCQRSLSTGDHLCRQNQPFCGLQTSIQASASPIFCQRSQFTWPELFIFWNSARNIAFSTIPRKITPPVKKKVQEKFLRAKHTNPELNSEDVPPVERTDNQPGESQHNIHPTHSLKARVSYEIVKASEGKLELSLKERGARTRTYSVERQERPVSDGKKASSGSSHLDVNTSFHGLCVTDGSHVDDQ